MTRKRPESLDSAGRLLKRSEYLRCYNRGKRLGGPVATFFVLSNDLGAPRLGLTASRKLGCAVLRNLGRRRCREVYRRWGRRDELPAVDIVMNLKHPAIRRDFEEVKRALEDQLSRLLTGDWVS